MRKLIIVGAGGHAREMLEWVRDINAINSTWEFAGFIDDNCNALQGTNCAFSVLGSIQDWNLFEDIDFAMGIASPKIKELVSKYLLAKGANFVSIIHPSVRIAGNARMGLGFVAYPDAFVCSNTKIGDFVTVLSSKISHDCVVDDFCTILSYVGLNGNTHLGKRVFVGNHATMMQGLEIGDDVSVGLGSVVIKDIPEGVHVFGNPARTLPNK